MTPAVPATARLLRGAVLLLVGLASVWAWWWAARGSILVAVIGATVLLLAHAPVLALEFVLVHAFNRHDRAPRASLRELLSAWWNETRLGVQVFAWQQPFRSAAEPDHLDPAGARGRRGLVLVHGFMCTRGLWNGWMPRLRALGVPHVAVNLVPPFGDIDRYASIVDDAVRRVREATGLPPVIVAHSMGGLATRAWLRTVATQATRPVHRVITLGTPHHGTAVGHHGPMKNVNQMRQGSAWLDALAKTESSDLRQRFTCFYSHCDNIVFPATTATLEDADNRHLRAMAHVQLLEHPEVFAAVVQAVGAHAEKPHP